MDGLPVSMQGRRPQIWQEMERSQEGKKNMRMVRDWRLRVRGCGWVAGIEERGGHKDDGRWEKRKSRREEENKDGEGLGAKGKGMWTGCRNQ